MNISARTEYACIAVLELAVNYHNSRPMRIRDIAESNGIPARFLVQILLQLKAAGIVGSTRGAAGGYSLSRPPAEVTLADVMAVSEGSSHEPVGSTGKDTIATRTLLGIWGRIARAEQQMLEGVTFADLVDRVRGETENMYYI